MTASHWNLRWSERPAEEARIFNPAFCGEVLCRSVGEYWQRARAPMNIALAFLILPLSLHKGTRDQLPKRASVAFVGWIAEHHIVIAESALRVERMRPVVRESMIFAIRHRRLAVQDGGLIPGEARLPLSAKASVSTTDADEARSAAALLGRWFAAQGEAAPVLQGFGVLP